MTKGIEPTHFHSLRKNSQTFVEGEIVSEDQVCLSVNGLEIATFMCTGSNLDQLGLGLLYNEGIIDSLADVASIHISKTNCIEIWLSKEFIPPEKFIVTAGCGGGITFDDLSGDYAPLQSDLIAEPNELAELMKELQFGAELYQRSRGIHTAVLATTKKVILQVEDIGRHNCLDKLAGASLNKDIPTSGLILLSSGRISSEMMNKARRLETPIVCSRTSPTSLSVQLAEHWNITVVGYLRQSNMRVYTHPERIAGVEFESNPKGRQWKTR